MFYKPSVLSNYLCHQKPISGNCYLWNSQWDTHFFPIVTCLLQINFHQYLRIHLPQFQTESSMGLRVKVADSRRYALMHHAYIYHINMIHARLELIIICRRCSNCPQRSCFSYAVCFCYIGNSLKFFFECFKITNIIVELGVNY